MRNELDEKLKKVLSPAHLPDIETFTNRVMEHLREDRRKEEQFSFPKELLYQLPVFNKGGLKTLLKITAGFAAVIVVIILTLIFIPNYGPSTSPKTFGSSEMLNNTSPCYILNVRIKALIMETRPCDILPPLSD